MTIDVAILGILATVLLWLLGVTFYAGKLCERIMKNKDDIKQNREENRGDHQLIFRKLDELLKLSRNGHGNSG